MPETKGITTMFRRFLNEGKDMLDISIQAAGKYLTSKAKIQDFLSDNVIIEHKTDGVKVTIIKTSNNGNINDYIVSYKGNVLYSEEYDYQPTIKVKKESIGSSQFKSIFQHLNKLGKNTIPVSTELFIEYLMRKPTLSSNYSKVHKMVLIAHAKSSYSVKFGKLKSNPSGFNTDKRDDYAKELKIDVPQHLFSGIMGSESTFLKGIKNKLLLKEFNAIKNSMQWNNPEILLDDIRRLFLGIESKYGGTEEGIVIKTSQGRVLKYQQEYQVDQAQRLIIKQKYREDTPEEETLYWNSVKDTARTIADSIVVKSRKLPDLMQELSTEMKRLKLTFSHSKKTDTNIKDDVQLNAKTLLIKRMRGNAGVLIQGKFRVLTKDGHYKLIKRAITLYDTVVINLVTSSDTKDTKELRQKMLEKAFPGITVIHSVNGNLIRAINKSPVNINAVYAGSDRVQSYKEQLKNSMGIDVKELPRNNDDISASKVIENITNEQFFNANTPKEIHSMYKEIKTYYG